MACENGSVSGRLRSITTWGGVFCALLTMAHAGEKVRFSDTKNPASASQNPLLRPDRSESPFGGLLDRGSSLSGVTAPPFAPPNQAPVKPLTPRERELLEKRARWIERSPDDISINEKNANDAMGVRDYSLDSLNDPESLSPELGGTDLGKSPKPTEQQLLRQREELKAKKQGGDPDRDDQTNSRDPDRRDTSIDFNKEMPHFEADMSVTKSPEPESFLYISRELERDSMATRSASGGGITGMMRTTDRPSFMTKAAEARSEEFKKLLGSAPGESAVPGLKLGGLDSISFQSDLTRKELNPVVVGGPAKASPGLQPSLAETVRPFSPPSSAAGSFTESLLPRAAAPALGAPMLSPIQDRRVMERSPLVLDAPKRTF